MRDADNPVDPDLLPDAAGVAAYWLARETAGLLTAAQEKQRDAWLRASPSHAQEYARARGAYNATLLVPVERLRALMTDPPLEHQPGKLRSLTDAQMGRSHLTASSVSRRRFGLGLGVACTALAATGIGVFYRDASQPSYQLQVASAIGEYRRVTLPDDSIVELNTNTRLSVRFYSDRRMAILEEGEAAFTVTPDAQRPFLVEAGDTTVRVTGTIFGVRRQAQAASVSVLSGSVQVKQGPWWNPQQANLRAGQAVMPAADQRFHVLSAQDTAAALAWREGRVVFLDTPLSIAVDELNRYTHRPIRLHLADADKIRIAGAFSTHDVDGFLELIPGIAPVAVRRLDNGTAIIVGKDANLTRGNKN